jgi:hypothetical protein
MENNNKVIFIIAIVIVILVTLIAILYANKVRPKPVQATNYDIKVYKSHVNENAESGHSYGECIIDSSNKALLIAEFQKIVSLGDSSIINEQSINGTYRLDYKDNMIAFDDTSGVVYVKSKNALYYYDSSIYQKVIDYCG